MPIQDLTAGTAQTIGRYFSLVSMVPSTLLTLYLFLLAKSGAWHGKPDIDAAAHALTDVTVGGVAALVVVALAVALFTHPIQFSIVQFFEGYWGVGPLAGRARDLRIEHHRRRWDRLNLRATERDAEASRLLEYYPDEPRHCMPTRLGNVLRRHEMQAGSQWNLDVLVVLPYIALVAEQEDLRYLDDQRSQLDLSVRMCATSLIACAASVLCLWRDGLWLLIAMIPYGLAYLSYRGAITTAQEFGKAVATIIDMNRFALYSRLRLPMPNDTEEERRTNADLMVALQAPDDDLTLNYDHPTPTDPTPPS